MSGKTEEEASAASTSSAAALQNKNKNTNTNKSDPLLDVLHREAFLTRDECDALMRHLEHVPLYRPVYTSGRYGRTHGTPCYTTVFGGFAHIAPFDPMPAWLVDLRSTVERGLALPVGHFNVALIRCYANDGKDTIAWHTDSRAFLGAPTTVASLSLNSVGNERKFEMKRVPVLWPTTSADYRVNAEAKHPILQWTLRSGDLFVMKGLTQEYFHHRVPPKPGSGVRWNINFRRILSDDQLARRGVDTFYRYCRWGDQMDKVLQNPESEDIKLEGSVRAIDFIGKSEPPQQSTGARKRGQANAFQSTADNKQRRINDMFMAKK